MRILVVYSGGMDSFTLLNEMIKQNKERRRQAHFVGEEFEVRALSFHYGQRHSRELIVAKRVTKILGIEHHMVDLTAVGALLDGSSLTGDTPVPHGHYTADNMKSTVVPGRNTIMLAIAMGVAENLKFDEVTYGAHAGDHAIYPDCRPPFVDQMRKVYYFATDGTVSLKTPYLSHTKGQILREGLLMRLDYSLTWTCYEGGETPCGKCGACVERAEAFAQNNTGDPLLLACL